MSDLRVVGQRVPFVDARDKVTGKAEYVSDIRLPGMLFGKILRSPLPHAQILDINISAAKKVKGVKAIITGKDVPREKFGAIIADENILATDKVRFVGDEVAAVAAIDEDAAEEALSMIKVSYRELSAVFDMMEAMADGAPLIHDKEKNIAYHTVYKQGDVDAAMAEADDVIEEEFTTSLVYQAYLEPMGGVASVDSSGSITIWAGLQNPGPSKEIYARALGLKPDQLRIIVPHYGGGFGAKMAHKIHPLAAIMSMYAGLPVYLVNSRREDFAAGVPRMPMIIKVKLGIKKDGTITAKDVRIVGDNGAYTNLGPAIINTASYRIDALYARIRNLRTVSDLVYTNKAPTSAFRGFGNNQMHFAMESMLDIAAERTGLDPLEIRLRNVSRAGDVNPYGWRIKSCGIGECLIKVTENIDWQKKRTQKRFGHGVGLAGCVHVSGNRSFKKEYDGSSAMVRIDENGLAFVYTGETDLGQGCKTVFAQIAAEELGFPLECVKVPMVDTDISPLGLGTFGSRVTFLGGNAVKRAAADARQQLLAAAGFILKELPEKLTVAGRNIAVKGAGTKISVCEVMQHYVCSHAGTHIVGLGHFVPEAEYPDQNKYGNISGAYPFAANAMEVEVDTETGRVKLLHISAAHDLGKAINPMAAEGQIEGGVAQGIGYALMEDLIYMNGKVANDHFLDYQIPTFPDMPPIKTFLVETSDRDGPFGAKAVGEPSLIPSVPAIANAIYDAVGVRIRDLPITPEKILKALAEKNKDR